MHVHNTHTHTFTDKRYICTVHNNACIYTSTYTGASMPTHTQVPSHTTHNPDICNQPPFLTHTHTLSSY